MTGSRILALETSCDETALAVFDANSGIVGEWIHSQVALHGKHGGVVPDLATREHLRNLGPLLARVRSEVDLAGVRGLAVTYGPGLAACLAMGLASAKALSIALKVPLVGVNHLRGHAWSPFLPIHASNPTGFDAALAGALPHLGLIVSGGNTMLVSIDPDRKIRTVATTRDDAAGEALDKGAKLLGLGYPGGPAVERLARDGNAAAFEFPKAVGPRRELAFSFSGVKTSLRYQLEKMSAAEIESRRAELCASYQRAVLEALVRKTRHVLEGSEGTYRSLGLSGGVANNASLRASMASLAKEKAISFLAAEPRHTGDNAGMIGFAAWIDPKGVDSRGLALPIEPGLEL